MANIVLPGEFLGTEEEFAAGTGTRVEEGKIYAAVFGTMEVSRDKVVSVRARVQAPKPINAGSVVYGRVEEIFEPVALIQLQAVEWKEGRQIPPEGYSVLHASRVKQGYVENIHDEVRIGDIVKCSVEGTRKDGEIGLSMKAPGLGVVKAYCSRCRGALALIQGGLLKCGRCGSEERRRLSTEYSFVKQG